MKPTSTSRRRWLENAGLAAAATALAGCPKRAASRFASQPDVKRLNIIFHGIPLFQATGNGVSVYIPMSNDPITSQPVHDYRVRVTQGKSSSFDDFLYQTGFGSPIDWTSGISGNAGAPAISPSSNVVLSGKQFDKAWAHAVLLLPCPHEMPVFRVPVAGTDPFF
jgi:hypothetical protein